jgi:hypothetical protein
MLEEGDWLGIRTPFSPYWAAGKAIAQPTAETCHIPSHECAPNPQPRSANELVTPPLRRASSSAGM